MRSLRRGDRPQAMKAVHGGALGHISAPLCRRPPSGGKGCASDDAPLPVALLPTGCASCVGCGRSAARRTTGPYSVRTASHWMRFALLLRIRNHPCTRRTPSFSVKILCRIPPLQARMMRSFCAHINSLIETWGAVRRPVRSPAPYPVTMTPSTNLFVERIRDTCQLTGWYRRNHRTRGYGPPWVVVLFQVVSNPSPVACGPDGSGGDRIRLDLAIAGHVHGEVHQIPCAPTPAPLHCLWFLLHTTRQTAHSTGRNRPIYESAVHFRTKKHHRPPDVPFGDERRARAIVAATRNEDPYVIL